MKGFIIPLYVIKKKQHNLETTLIYMRVDMERAKKNNGLCNGLAYSVN